MTRNAFTIVRSKAVTVGCVLVVGIPGALTCAPHCSLVEEDVNEATAMEVSLLQFPGGLGHSGNQLNAMASVGKGNRSKHGGCHLYGCGGGYRRWQSCQCNSKCGLFNNCCLDYKAACVGSSQGDGSPQSPSDARELRPKGTLELPFGHPRAGYEYPKYPGFTLWLVEEFNEPLDLDHDLIWTWSDGGLQEGQVRFAKEQIKFENGKMKLEARVGIPLESPAQWCSHAEVGHVGPKRITSGELRTRHNMFRYGLYEVRMKAPVVQPGNIWVDGNYIATMFAYRDAKYKHWREIDFEILGESRHTVTTNVLVADNTDKWSPGIQADSHKKYWDIDVRNDFHTYAFAWLPNKITWYIDGKVIREHRTGWGKIPVPEMSTKIIMNLWIFDHRYKFGGTHGWNDQFPMHSEYDWFRFYRWDGDTRYPCADMNESCLSPSDLYLSGNNPCDGIPQLGTLPSGLKPCVAKCL